MKCQKCGSGYSNPSRQLVETGICVLCQNPADALAAGHPEFHRILDEMRALHVKKAADYGSDEDPLHNVRAGAKFVNIPAWQAAILRMSDKMVRIEKFIKKGSLQNESVEDSIQDIAAYAVIALILYRETAK